MSRKSNTTKNTPPPLMATPEQIASSGYPQVPAPVRNEPDLMEDETMDEPGTPPGNTLGTQLPPQTPSNSNKRVRKGPAPAASSSMGNPAEEDTNTAGLPTTLAPALASLPATASDVTLTMQAPPASPATAPPAPTATAAPMPTTITGMGPALPPPTGLATPSEALALTGDNLPVGAAPPPAAPPTIPVITAILASPAIPATPPTTSSATLNAPPAAGNTMGATATPALPPLTTTQPPRLQGVTKEEVFKNMNRTMLAQWEAITGIKVIILPYDPGYAPDRVMATNAKLRSAIMSILQLPAMPPLGPPAPEKPTNDRANNAPPYGFMLGPVSAEEEQLLTARQVWSTEAISFFALPWNPSPGTFIGTITGLTYEPDAPGINAISQKLKNLIFASVPILQLVEERHDTIPNYIDPAMGLATLLNTMQIRPWDDDGHTQLQRYSSHDGQALLELGQDIGVTMKHRHSAHRVKTN
ncbi:hypothetical protein EYR40_010404 [Pleurotus pulmonarius]|nr:hypothetical protein EYR40_010404 [Pleurotus pulmonarius]